MDRARPTDSLRARAHRRILTIVPVVGALSLFAIGCDRLTGDFDRVIAIEIVGSLTRALEEGDTTRLVATALSARGEPVPDATIIWGVLDPEPVGFSIDSTAGLVQALEPGTGRVQARFETLRAEPITITVTPAADSLTRQGADTVVVATGAAASDAIAVIALDITTAPGTESPVAGTRVRFAFTSPGAGAASLLGVSLATPDSTAHPDPHDVSTTTSGSGVASATVLFAPGSQPQSPMVVTVSGFTATGTELAGSPIEFVITIEATPPSTGPRP